MHEASHQATDPNLSKWELMLRCMRETDFDPWAFTESISPELFADATAKIAVTIARI
jgi:hypothetical protein